MKRWCLTVTDGGAVQEVKMSNSEKVGPHWRLQLPPPPPPHHHTPPSVPHHDSIRNVLGSSPSMTFLLCLIRTSVQMFLLFLFDRWALTSDLSWLHWGLCCSVSSLILDLCGSLEQQERLSEGGMRDDGPRARKDRGAGRLRLLNPFKIQAEL